MVDVGQAKDISTKRLWKLPSGWEWVTIGEICIVKPKRPQLRRDNTAPTSFVPMAVVNDIEGSISKIETRPYVEVAHGYSYFEENDVLFAKITPSMENGKCAIAQGLVDGIGFGSTEFHVLRPTVRTTPQWLHYYLRRTPFRLEAKEHFKGNAGQKRVPQQFLTTASIPLPHCIDIQNRLTSRIEALFVDMKEARRNLERMQHDINRVMDTILKETMEDLENNSSHALTLGSLIANNSVRLITGKTPHKQDQRYWNGTIPWVSPKDVKSWYIKDAQFHNTSLALQSKKAKLIPEKSVLIVVRSDILKHSIPVAINMVPVTMNQDIKALLIIRDFVPEYIGYVLRARAPLLLQQVESAQHGVAKLETEKLKNISIPIIPKEEQVRVIAYLDANEENISKMQEVVREDLELFRQTEDAILAEAFRGKL